MADYNITAVTRRVVYTGSAGVGPYAFTFPVISQTDIAVYKNSTKLILTTDYTVTVSSANGTGSVTLVVAATGSDRITIIGARAIERTTDFVTAGDLKASSLNEQLDASIILIQQLAEENKRTLKAPQFDPAAVEDGGTLNMILPVSTSRAGKILAFDTDGNPVAGEDIGNWRGNWAASVAFVVRDLVKDGSNSNVYRVNTAHTSSGTTPISSNADVAKFDLVVDAAASAASAAAASASASAASSSASAASTSASNASTSATNSSTSASNSSTSASAAAASAAAAAASFDAFDDIYLGAYSTNPTLDNDGNSLTTGDQYFNTTANELRVWNGSSWQAASVIGGTVSTLNVTGVASFADGSAALPSITNDGDTNTGIFFPAADTIAFAEGGAEAMRINSSGNVGIGTASPSSPLNVVASSGSGLAIAINGRSSDNTGAMYLYANDGTTQQATIIATATEFRHSSVPAAAVQTFYTNSAERMRINSSGQVEFTAGTAALPAITTTGDTNTGIFYAAADTVGIATGGSERMRIDSAGNVGIGASSFPETTRLGVASTSLTAVPFLVQQTAAGATNYNSVVFYRNSASTGSISATATTTAYNTSSDYRLKENVQPMQNALAIISALKPSTYDWIGHDESGEGFLAHELQEIIPIAVMGGKDAVNDDGSIKAQGVDHSKIVVHLVAAIQEQQAMITALTNRITALEV